MKITSLIVMLVSVSLLAGCMGDDIKEPSDYGLGNTVFPEAENPIITVLPAFDDTIDVTVPEFTWVATKRRLVFLGVFKNNIAIRDGAVVNRTDNIWAWHTGLGTAREGYVSFGDGRDVVNGKIQIDSAPTPLVSGRSYVWAVWAWDDEGLYITHSSSEMFFTVR